MPRRIAAIAFFIALLVVSAAVAKKKPPSQPVNINTASSAQLQMVPGIGPSTANRILQMRKSYGTFKSVNDLLAIRGIGEKRLDKMRKYITVSRPAAGNAAQSASCSSCGKQKSHPSVKSAPAKTMPQRSAQPRPAQSAPAQSEPASEPEEPR